MAAAKPKKVTTTVAKKSNQRITRCTCSQTSKRILTANGHVEDSGFESPAGDGHVGMDEDAPAQSTSQNDGHGPWEDNGQLRYPQSSRDIAELEKALSVTKGRQVTEIMIKVVSTHLS
jgi:hypothetical protein